MRTYSYIYLIYIYNIYIYILYLQDGVIERIFEETDLEILKIQEVNNLFSGTDYAYAHLCLHEKIYL